MADERPRRKRSDEEQESKPRRRRSDDQDRAPEGRRSREPRLSGAQLAKQARKELAEITGLKPEAVTSLDRSDDGTWRVTVELLELSRVPETDDLIGSYEAELDENGELVSYRRVRRYARSQSHELSGGAG